MIYRDKEEKLRWNPLVETTLGRVWQGVSNPDVAMGFFSAFRSFKEDDEGNKIPVSTKENFRRTDILKRLLASNRWGFSMVKGAWRDSTTNEIVTEPSFVVRVPKDDESKFKGFLRKLTRSSERGKRDGGDPESGTFDQDAVIFKPTESDEAFLITNEGQEFSIGKFHPNVIADNFTKIKNASFAFKEEVSEYSPSSWSEDLKQRSKSRFPPSSIITESSRSRLIEHINNHDCGCITAYRSWIYPEGEEHSKENEVRLTRKQNQARNLKLLGKLHQKGYDVIAVKGGYIEDYGTDRAKEVTEHTFFVVDREDKGRLKEDLVSLGTENFQDSILFIPKATVKGMRGILIGTSPRDDLPTNFFPEPGSEHTMSTFKSDMSEFFTRVQNMPFRFESITESFPYERPSFFSRGYVAYASMPVDKIEMTLKEDKNSPFA